MKIDNSEICLLIPSYNRYDKLVETLTNINEYSGLNVIVYNDGSDDERYYTIESNFKNVIVLHNSKNNGKIGYNDTVKFLFNEAINSNFNWFIYYADDMLLCKNFTDHVKPLFNDKEIVNIFPLHSGSWGCSAYIDGFFTMSKNSVKIMYNLIPNKLIDIENKSTGVWSTVTKEFSVIKPKLDNIKLCCLNYSLCQHYGNDDSKLHPKFRLTTPIIAYNFYDDFYGEQINIISYSGLPTKVNKKATSNGSLVEKDEPTIISRPIALPVTNSPIEHDRSGLDNIREGLNKQKQSRITKINDDIFIAKARKRNLRLGGR